MPTMRINKSGVDRLKPAPGQMRPVLYFDDVLRGFGVLLYPSGQITYFVQYRLGRGRKAEKPRLKIGVHGSPWTPDMAREDAKKKLADVARGEDPAADRRAERDAPTVADLCDIYLKAAEAGTLLRRGKKKKLSTIATDRGRIERHIKPLLGNKLVKDVTDTDIADFIANVTTGKTATTIERKDNNGIKPHGRVVVKGGAGTAARTAGLLGGIFSYAVRPLKLRGDNPVDGVERLAPKRRKRVLSPDEYRRLGEAMAALAAQGANKHQIAALRLAALCGGRKTEMFALRWGEIDFDGRALRLTESKGGDEDVHTVRPLGKPALELLRKLAEKKADETFVFRGKGGGKPIKGSKVIKEAFRLAKIANAAPTHVFRHSLASTANSLHYSRATVADLLGHSRTGNTTDGYIHSIDSVLLAAADEVADRIARMMDGKPLEDTAEVVDLQSRRA